MLDQPLSDTSLKKSSVKFPGNLATRGSAEVADTAMFPQPVAQRMICLQAGSCRGRWSLLSRLSIDYWHSCCQPALFKWMVVEKKSRQKNNNKKNTASGGRFWYKVFAVFSMCLYVDWVQREKKNKRKSVFSSWMNYLCIPWSVPLHSI